MRRSQLDNILDHIAEETKKLFGEKLDSVILYGSYARGDFNDESDIDIMIIADIPMDESYGFTRLLHQNLSHVEIDNDCVISFSIVENEKFRRFREALPFYRNVYREGIKIAG